MSKSGLAALFSLSWCVLLNGASYTYRAGINTYDGADDVTITNQYGSNGVTQRGITNGCYRITGTNAYSSEVLVRFSGLGLDPGTHVTSATLTLTLTSWTSGAQITGSYLKASWNAASSALGWANRDSALAWTSPGAQGDGTDLVSGAQFTLGAIGANGDQTITVSLDPSIVDTWVNDPASNQGVLLRSSVTDKIVRLYSSRYSDVNRRPLLTIVTASNPPSVSLAIPTNGATLQGMATFNASASSPSGIAAVQFLMDGQLYGSQIPAPPFSIAVNTASLSNGPHAVAARAWDTLGQTATTAAVNVTASNNAPAGTTLTFRSGEGSYTSTQDLTISNQNGSTTTRADLDSCYATTGTSAYISKTLVKFAGIQIPAGQQVSAATLTLTFNTWVTGYNIQAYAVQNAWNFTTVAWQNRDTGLPWGAPGATSVPVDITGPVFTIGTLKATGDQRITLTLDPALVNSWVENPAANQGILLLNDTAGKIVRIYSSRTATLANRPLLSITTVPAGPDTTPPQVSMTSPADGVQVSGLFTAAANATDNAGVPSVQFLLDGAAYGAVLSAAPYTVQIDATNLSQGNHTIAAQATDGAGNTTLSASRSFVIPAAFAPSSAFFAPPLSTGTVSVRLYPTENVKAGVATLVTFGIPFSRGSLRPADLNTLRVLVNGQETPAYVALLTPWRHTTNPAVDAQWVRVARIQLTHVFSTLYPGYENVVVTWGQGLRTQSVSTFQNPRSAWHLVSSGTFVAADKVYEPDVYAVLPPDYMNNGALPLTQTVPFPASILPTRDDPTAILSTPSWPDYQEFQLESKNFFYTTVNQDDSRVAAANLSPYKTDYEPWLYDRSATIYNLYFQSGFFSALREAVRSSQFYMNNLYTSPASVAGIFKLKNPDPAAYMGANGAMYSYNENLAYTYWLTGDDQPLPYITWVAEVQKHVNDISTRWSPTLGGWTERAVGFRLLDYVVAYEITGNYKSDIVSMTADLEWHQNGAGGQLPANRVDGGLYHTGKQAGDGTPTRLLASPWMSVLLVNAMVRAYAVTEDSAIADFVRRMGTFLKTSVRSDTNQEYTSLSLYYPDYITAIDGTPDMRDEAEVEHSLDVQTAVAWSYFFGKLLNVLDTTMKDTAANLYVTFHYGARYWTRPSAPASGNSAFRVSPWRKYGWTHHPAVSLTWVMQQ